MMGKEHLPPNEKSSRGSDTIQLEEKRSDRSISVRLPSDLLERLEQHSAMRQLTADNKADRVSRSDVIREALAAYLDGYEDQLRADLQRVLDKGPG